MLWTLLGINSNLSVEMFTSSLYFQLPFQRRDLFHIAQSPLTVEPHISLPVSSIAADFIRQVQTEYCACMAICLSSQFDINTSPRNMLKQII